MHFKHNTIYYYNPPPSVEFSKLFFLTGFPYTYEYGTTVNSEHGGYYTVNSSKVVGARAALTGVASACLVHHTYSIWRPNRVEIWCNIGGYIERDTSILWAVSSGQWTRAMWRLQQDTYGLYLFPQRRKYCNRRSNRKKRNRKKV